ncbi:MAG: hypothetical protein CMH56_09300, partial [Myxococcales bacterium]|nr:hypothetical protein [Myxococcales bacterium]
MTIVLFGVGVVGGAAYHYWNKLKDYGQQSLGGDGIAELVIPQGSNPKKVARMLQEKGIIQDAEFFYRYARFIAEEAHKIKAGEYVLDKSMTPFELLRAIQTGKRKEIRFTVPEGSSKVDIVKIIAKAGFGEEAKLIALMEDQDLIKSFGVPERGA